MPLKNADVSIDTDAIVTIADKLEIELTSDDPVKQVEELRAAFTKRLENIPEDDWIKCEKCGEVTDSDDRIEYCPFCGDEGEDEDLIPPPPDGAIPDEAVDGADILDAVPDPVEASPVDITGDENVVPEPEKTAEKAAEKPKGAKASTKKKGIKGKGTPAKKKGIKGKGTPAKKKGAKKRKVVETAIISEEQKAEMLPELLVEKKKIEAGQRAMITSGYDLGESIRRIFTGELWRAEGHKDFRVFCKSIGISHTLAYSLMKIVDQFDRKTFLEVGRKKLELIARADSKDRSELLEGAKGGKSVRQLKEESKKVGKTGTPPDPKGVDGGTAGRPTIEGQMLTLLAKVGGTAKTFAFRSSKTHEEVVEWVPDDCYVEIPISETVVQYIVVKTCKAGKPIGLTTAFRKVEKKN